MRMSPSEFLARFPDHPTSAILRAEGVKPDTGKGKDNVSTPKKKQKRTKKIGSKATPSHLEALFEQHLLGMKAPKSEREYQFHPERGWRMDFAWPEYRVAVEIEGGVWSMGRHNRPKGFIADTEKYNAAAELGWIVLRFTAQAIRDGKAIDQTLNVLQDRESFREMYEPDPGMPVIMRRRSRPAV